MALTPGQMRLYSGDYNYMNQEWQPDGTVIITLSGGRLNRSHRLHIRNLWKDNEEVINEEEVNSDTPEHIQQRFKEAVGGTE